MINKKYKSLAVLKQRNSKLIERAQTLNKQGVVLKSYPAHQSDSISNEIHVYQKLKQPHLHGFAQVHEVFQFADRLYLVMQELGQNLDQLRVHCGGRLSLKTTLMLGMQILDRLQFLHDNGFLHGDIRPDNFLVGLGGKMKHKIYLVDFQLSSPFMINGKHIQPENLDSFSGTLRYSSKDANLKKNISRKDEIQSLLYSMIYLLKGDLPWTQINAQSISEAYELTGKLKATQRKELLEGLPDLFRKIFGFLDEMKFKDAPDYALIKKCISELMKKNGYDMDYKYDWEYL